MTLNQIVCFFRDHDDEVDDRLHGETTRLRCRRCHREKTIPVCEQNVSHLKLLTECVKNAYVELRVFEYGEVILRLKFDKQGAKTQGYELIQAAKSVAVSPGKAQKGVVNL